MKRKINRVMLSAPKSGSGKTLLTCALLATLKEKGYPVSSVKSGPDYIDPLFHKEVLGVPARNLDTWFIDGGTAASLLAQDRADGEYVVMEGVMGLFDGAGGTEMEGSSYDLARSTGTPIILVIDAKGAGFSILPMIAGFLSYDTANLIRGVILNRTSGVMAERLRPLIKEQLGIELIGYFPNQKNLAWESRYLGLTLPGEIAGVQDTITRAAAAFSESIPLEEILKIMENAPDLEYEPLRERIAETEAGNGAEISGNTDNGNTSENAEDPEKSGTPKVRIAVARDEAFCFYYEENMQILRALGAEIVPFSPIRDEKIPENVSGMLLGGGYPENYLPELEANASMRKSVKEAVEKGMPVRAECGGFMYLHDRIFDKEGKPFEMVGAVSGECRYTGKSQRFGYIEVIFPDGKPKDEERSGSGKRIRGHEFHYFDSTNNGEDCIAEKPVTGRQYRCMQLCGTSVFGYPHLYYPSGMWFAEEFVKQAREYAGGR
ncbi:MAG: cobyrinate a,c-diamide synthase [Lachnospiraceae bacterium]|nr:cobyrinate a,c-diamide synthase [Lachnospiraceae bacterium]